MVILSRYFNLRVHLLSFFLVVKVFSSFASKQAIGLQTKHFWRAQKTPAEVIAHSDVFMCIWNPFKKGDLERSACRGTLNCKMCAICVLFLQKSYPICEFRFSCSYLDGLSGCQFDVPCQKQVLQQVHIR